MAVLGNTYLNLLDTYKRSDAHGNIVDVIELLTKINPILADAITVECNMQTQHMHTVRTGLPSVAWGMLYKGIPQSKSRTAQVTDTTGFLEALSTVDKRLLDLTKDEGKLRLSEALSFLESMSQEFASTFIYGNTASDPEKFLGLAPRFNSTSAANGGQIVSAAGAGSDNTSIWMITWAENAVHLLHPQGTAVGVTREDKGEQRVTDGDGNPFYVKEEMFKHHVGLAVKDWRYVTRVANIDVSNMQAGSVKLYDFLRKAYYKHQGRQATMGKSVIYCNRDVLECLDALATNAGAADNYTRLKYGEIEGKEVLQYRGMPIRECQAILNTEAVVGA
jgi:hypothetical protein